MSRFAAPLLVSAGLALLVTGCTQKLEDIEEDAAERSSAAERLMNTTRPEQRQDTVTPSTVRFSNEVYLGSRSFRRDNGDPLPTRFDFVTLASAQPLSLPEVGGEITQLTGIPVVFETSFSETLEESLQAAEAAADGSPGAGEAQQQAQQQQRQADAGNVVQRITLNFSGPLKRLLDLVGARFGVTWSYDNNEIVFQDFVTRTFSVKALPGSSEVTSALSAATSAGGGGGGGGGGGAGGGSTAGGTSQEISIQSAIEVWEDIRSAIEAMTPDNSRISISRGTGTVTVTTSPVAMRRVRAFIQAQNDVLSRQVAISVQVLSVTLEEDEVLNFDLNAMFDSLEDEFGFNFAGPTQTPIGNVGQLGSFSGAILESPGNEGLGRFTGSSAVIEALSQIGRTSLLNTAAVTTLNNQVVPVQAVTRTDFVREQSVTNTVDVGTEVEITPGTTVTGFVINLLPRIMSNGEIFLQYAFSLSDLVNLREAGEIDPASGGAVVELPEISSTDFLQHVRLQSGDTLVLAGFQSAEDDAQRSGTGDPDNFILGGGRASRATRETLVLLISPVLLR